MGLLQRLRDLFRINQSSINQSIINQSQNQPQTIGIEKESLELGVAAGYTGHTIRTIESSLSRIESQMVTKDWFALQFKESFDAILDILKKHEENDQKRFEDLKTQLSSEISAQKTAFDIPIATQIPSEFHLTIRQQQLFSIVQEAKELSYADLAVKIGRKEDYIRGLLSLTCKKCKNLQRFRKDNKGWVRFTAIDAENQSQSIIKSENT